MSDEPKQKKAEDDDAEAGATAATDEAAEGDEARAEGDEAEVEAAEGESEAVDVPLKENRAERRRKKKRPDGESRDRNRKVREGLLKKRIESERVAEPLTAGEMVDDAFARAVASSGKWLKNNMNLVQYAVVALVLGSAGYAIWHWRTTTASEQTSSTLMAGVAADRGRVDPDAKKDPNDDLGDALTFKTAEARSEAALTAYRKVETSSKGTGAAILARLGEAGILLDKKAWDEALTAYREVKASALAAADPDVKGRSIEGIAFAHEGKGDRDAALSALKELETVSAQKGFHELALYHQARLLAMKGEKDKAVAMLKSANDRLTQAPEAKQLQYLKAVIEELWRSVDPATAPKKMPSMGGGAPGQQMAMEEQMRMVQELQEKMRKAQEAAPPASSK